MHCHSTYTYCHGAISRYQSTPAHPDAPTYPPDLHQHEADKLWWEDEESLKKQSYYLTNLCGYSTKLYKPLKAYLDAQDAKKNGDILGTKKNQDEEYDIDNLDWLNDL